MGNVLGIDERVEVIELIEQINADEVQNDKQIKAEDGTAGADLEHRDRHRERPGDEGGGGGDEE